MSDRDDNDRSIDPKRRNVLLTGAALAVASALSFAAAVQGGGLDGEDG
jgi:hypothetical protein